MPNWTGTTNNDNVLLARLGTPNRTSNTYTLNGLAGTDTFDLVTGQNYSTFNSKGFSIGPADANGMIVVSGASGGGARFTFNLTSVESLKFSDTTVQLSYGTPITPTDTTPPTVSGFSPVAGATGVGVASNIVLTFSEAVQLGTGLIEVHSGSATGAVVATSGCKWRTIPKYPGGSKRSVKIANKINEYAQMRIAEIPQLGMAFRHLAGGIYYHASAVEIKWKRDRFGVGVEGLYGIQPKRLSYAVSWRIHLWDELGNEYDPKLGIYPGVDIFATWPDRFAVHTPMPMGPEIPTRQGLGQVLTFYSMFSIWTVRDWMKFSELFGQPWRIAYFEKNADAADIQLAKQMLDRMSSMTTAVLPATAKFELEQPDGHNTVHHMLTTYLDAAMSKAVLGQTLTTEAPGHGTHALGKVQDRVRDDIARDDRVAMSETFHRYVLKPLIRKQFGQELCDLYCPTFELYPAASDDLQGEYTRAMGLADRGVPIECDWARSHFTMAPRPEGKQTQLYLYPMAQGANGGPPPLTEGEKRPKSPAEGGDDNGKDDNREGAGDIDDGE